MPRSDWPIARSLSLAAIACIVMACAAQRTPAPKALRGRDYPLVRVDREAVHGMGPVVEQPGSIGERTDCHDRVAEGSLHIAADGRSFIYRSTMRRCSGELLVTETNEGALEWRDSTLAFVIDETSGPVTFVGSWTDSTITIANFGGLLEFSRK